MAFCTGRCCRAKVDASHILSNILVKVPAMAATKATINVTPVRSKTVPIERVLVADRMRLCALTFKACAGLHQPSAARPCRRNIPASTRLRCAPKPRKRKAARAIYVLVLKTTWNYRLPEAVGRSLATDERAPHCQGAAGSV